MPGGLHLLEVLIKVPLKMMGYFSPDSNLDRPELNSNGITGNILPNLCNVAEAKINSSNSSTTKNKVGSNGKV